MERRSVSIVSSIVCAATVAGAGAVGALAAQPSVLFKHGFDLCKAAPLSAVRKAGGQPYRAGGFDSLVCNWERPDFKAGITFGLLTGAEATALKPRLTSIHGTGTGPGGVKMQSTKVPGASAAVIEALPHAIQGESSKELFMVFPQGIARISMTAPGSLANARVLAVARTLTG